MASWKKMAEAFGRAVHNRERLTDHAPLSNKGRIKAERADDIEDTRWQRMADKAGAGEEFRRGFNDEELLPDNGSDIRGNDMAEFVPAKEFSSVQRNQAELDDAITAALDKRYGTDERAKTQARRDVIADLKNGTDVSTVLDRLDRSRMDDTWDKAFKQSTAKFKDQSSILTDEDADAWRSELLRTIDILRKRGFSDGDILNTIKGK
jgi:hypothetical protein